MLIKKVVFLLCLLLIALRLKQAKAQTFFSEILNRVNTVISSGKNSTRDFQDSSNNTHPRINSTTVIRNDTDGSFNMERVRTWQLPPDEKGGGMGFGAAKERYEQRYSNDGFNQANHQPSLVPLSPLPVQSSQLSDRSYMWQQQQQQGQTVAPMAFHRDNVFFTYPWPVPPDNLVPISGEQNNRLRPLVTLAAPYAGNDQQPQQPSTPPMPKQESLIFKPFVPPFANGPLQHSTTMQPHTTRTKNDNLYREVQPQTSYFQQKWESNLPSMEGLKFEMEKTTP